MQHVQINAGPLTAGPPMAHVYAGIKGKGKSKHGTTACGETFDLDDATILSPMVRSTWGRCADCHREDHDDTDTVTEPVTSADDRPHRDRCDVEPPSNGESNQSCILANRHTEAHRNGRISWSGVDKSYSMLGPQERQLAQNRELGEAIAATYNGGGPLGTKPNGKTNGKRLAAKGVDALLPPAPQELRLEQLDVGDIERSPLNHRTRFDGIEELGADIRLNGLRVPIKVRPMPSTYPTRRRQAWEIVYGERRWRAAKSAGVESLPALIAELDDLAVIKEQLVENVSRMDVHPLEEADGYQLLIDQHGYDAQKIADETGKSKAYVYARLKLTSLAPGARVEFFAGRLSASIALLIARIPDMSLQDQATREVMGEAVTPKYGPDHDALTSEGRRVLLTVDEEDVTGEEDEDPSLLIQRGKAVRVPMSVREAQVHLQRRYMLRLELAKFPTDDATLVSSAGACTTCDFRTGNQRDLFGEVSRDSCTKPDCFAEKAKAEGDRRAREAEAKGAKVVTGKAAEKVFERNRRGDHPRHFANGHTAEIASSSPYVDPTERLGWGLLGNMGKVQSQTWDKLLGKKLAAKVPSVVVVHPETGEARELLDKNKAIEVLREAGKLPKAKKESSSSSSDDWRAKHAREMAKNEKERELAKSALRSLLTEDVFPIACGLEDLDECPRGTAELVKWLRWAIASILEIGRSYNLVTAELHLGDEKASKGDIKGKLLDRFVAEIKNPDRAQGVLTSMLIEELAPSRVTDKSGGHFELFDDGLKLMGLGTAWKKHIEVAKKAQDAADKAEADKVAAKEAKKPAAKKPAKKGRKC